MNKIILGFFEKYLNEGDEVLLTKSEHASNVLPWFELKKRKNIVIKYIPLNEYYEVKIDKLEEIITDKTKVISLAHITNVIGDQRPIKEITALAHNKNILVVCDGAQSVPHLKTDVTDLDVDFLVFSAHKMLGPTGLGILYGKEKYLKLFDPVVVGGGMNKYFDYEGNIDYSDMPYFLEAGTPNISSIIAFGKIIEYYNKLNLNVINSYILELREYAVLKLKEIRGIKIYNENIESSIITFNYKDIDSISLAEYLNKYKICVRAGNHCAKMLKDEIGISNTCRISLYFYNNKEEIDYLIAVLNNPNLREEIM